MPASQPTRLLTHQPYMVFGYLCRNRTGGKTFGAILLRGQPTAEQRLLFAVQRGLPGPVTFLPAQLGVPRLDTAPVRPQPRLLADHAPPHELEGLRPATQRDLERLAVWGTMATFTRVFARTQRRVQPVVTRAW
jgi:hypothetical protein